MDRRFRNPWDAPVLRANTDIREGRGRVVVLKLANGQEAAFEVDEVDLINGFRYPNYQDR